MKIGTRGIIFSLAISICFLLSVPSHISLAAEIEAGTVPLEIEPKKVMKTNKRPYIEISQETRLQSQFEMESGDVDALMGTVVHLQKQREDLRVEMAEKQSTVESAKSLEEVSRLREEYNGLEEQYEGLGAEMQMQLTALQNALQKQQQTFNTLSNVLRTSHESKKNTIRNMK